LPSAKTSAAFGGAKYLFITMQSRSILPLSLCSFFTKEADYKLIKGCEGDVGSKITECWVKNKEAQSKE